MRARLAPLVVMSILCGLPAAHAVETSRGPAPMVQQLHATAPNANVVTSVSQPPLEELHP